jgi:hypothetical protein
MTPSLSLSLWAYQRLLTLYPRDLRRDFGADMIEAFTDDLGAARGFRGALRVWRSALCELMQIAVPAWFEIPEVVVPTLSAVIVAVSQSPLIILAVRMKLLTDPADQYLIVTDSLIGVGIGTAISALTSFVAIHRRKRAGLITLRIG